MNPDLLDLDADGLLAAATELERTARLAEVDKLEVLSAWAALHSADPTEGPEGRHARRVGNVLKQVGGEGTPGVQDFCLGEIALARGAGVTATQHALADVLDLQHRLPLTWAVCRRGDCEVWVARRVAKLSRHLPADKVGVVDTAIARMIATEGIGRVLEVAAAKIIEADTQLHEETCEAERRRRYVGLGRTDEHGLRTLIARLDAGDAVAVDAIVTRVVEIIAPRHPEAHPDELRALAFSWLARPTELLQLLLEHATPPPELELDPDDEPADPDDPAPARPFALPADLLDALRDLDLTPLAPKAVLHVHLHEAVINGAAGVARVEGLGPVTLTQLTELLRRFDVKVQPVKDLSARIRFTSYEHPESLRDQVHLVTGGDYWPYAGFTPVRRGPLRLAHATRPRLPRRPHRHPPDPSGTRTDDLRGTARRGHLPGVGTRGLAATSADQAVIGDDSVEPPTIHRALEDPAVRLQVASLAHHRDVHVPVLGEHLVDHVLRSFVGLHRDHGRDSDVGRPLLEDLVRRARAGVVTGVTGHGHDESNDEE